MKTVSVNLHERSYDITIEKGGLKKAGKLMNLCRRVFILTDSGVPAEYAEEIAKTSKHSMIYTVECGEGAKSLEVLGNVLSAMLDFGLSRSDCAVAVGGGVVGDLMGFAASVYMRGIDFYNVPTTLLSMVDSSIGGKTAINLGGVKNSVGAFYQPKHVLIDADVLKTLPKRHYSAGLAESVKMALSSDSDLFSFFECEEVSEENIEKVIERSLMIKKAIVEADEREGGLRKILNLGHTLGHGIESATGLYALYHGECVALGMLAVCSEEIKARLIPILKKIDLPIEYEFDLDEALNFVIHDKKASDGYIDVVTVQSVGKAKIERLKTDEFKAMVKARFNR